MQNPFTKACAFVRTAVYGCPNALWLPQPGGDRRTWKSRCAAGRRAGRCGGPPRGRRREMKTMSELEMRKLGRKELLDALADREDEIDRLRLRLVDVEKRLSDREIKIDRAGSIAEAAMSLSGVFESAEKAASQYLENIERLSSRQESVCREMEEKSRAEAERILADARKRADTLLATARQEAESLLSGARQLEADTKRECEQMKAKAETEAEQHWETVSRRLRQFCQSREELKALLLEKSAPLDGGEP